MQEETMVRTALSNVAALRREASEASIAEIERDLVDRAKNGSADAFGQLVERYHTRVFRTAYNITRHHEDAEDVMQNAFLKAFDKLSLFRGDSRFSTWLVSITINEAFMRKRRHRVIEVSLNESGEAADAVVTGWVIRTSWPNPEECCWATELRGTLTAVLNKLKPESRLVFQLRDIEGFSTLETAEALNLTVATVKTRLHRVRMILRRSLVRCIRSQNDARMPCISPERAAGLESTQNSRCTSPRCRICQGHSASHT
jgi:RNA polymerase sigma-70 factor (ECF subfamily)